MSDWIEDVGKQAAHNDERKRLSDEGRRNDQVKIAVMFDEIAKTLIDQIESDVARLRTALRLKRDGLELARFASNSVVVMMHEPSVQLTLSKQRPLLHYSY
ncbi:MAG: hypothetical protein M3Z85_21335, partial [Acidobacteriota bacterium]|nr:hypothetical protein [Acidobacteriota bacterium]